MSKDNEPIFTDKQGLKSWNYQGGLSERLFWHPVVQEYIQRQIESGGNVWGYIGSYSRTVELDRRVESTLKEQGLRTVEIAEFLVSKSGRHFADALTYKPLKEAVSMCLGKISHKPGEMKVRKLKVYNKQSSKRDGRPRGVSEIRLIGQWVREAGFKGGDEIHVEVLDNKLIITNGTIRKRQNSNHY